MSTQRQTNHTHAAQNIQVPTKDQAVVLDSIDGISIQEYALAVGNVIDPSLSQGRVCLYLNSKETVEKITENRSKVKKSIIPNYLTMDYLSKAGIVPCLPISYIRAGLNDSRFSHIMCFRRQM